MKKLLSLVILTIALASAASAQNTTVSGTVTDSDSIAWASGTLMFNITGASGTIYCNGTKMTPSQLSVVASLDSTGSFSTGVCRNSSITPVSSQWAITVCSAASAPCQNLGNVTIAGSTQSLTSFITAAIKPIRIPIAFGTRAYADGEIVNPPLGGVYFNLTSAVNRTWNGTSWSSPAIVPQAASINPFLMPHWIACTAKVKINIGSCRVYAVGDSTTFGAFSTPDGTGDLAVGAYPARLAQYMTSSVLPAQRDSFMGDPQPGNDSRISVGSWVENSGVPSTGGPSFNATAATGGPLTFTPTDSVDTFELWYIGVSVGGTFSYSIDSGSATNVNTASGVTGVIPITIAAGSLGSHTLKLTWVSGNDFVVGAESYNSAISSVRVTNAGWPGSRSGDWTNNGAPYNTLSAVQTQAPDLIILDLGINDWGPVFGEPVSAFQANMQTLITAWLPTSDIVIVTPNPTAVAAGTPAATQQQYVAAMHALAVSNNIPIIDNFARWGSYELKNPAPFLFYSTATGNDGLHPNGNGYSDAAQSIASQLLFITGK